VLPALFTQPFYLVVSGFPVVILHCIVQSHVRQYTTSQRLRQARIGLFASHVDESTSQVWNSIHLEFPPSWIVATPFACLPRLRSSTRLKLLREVLRIFAHKRRSTHESACNFDVKLPRPPRSLLPQISTILEYHMRIIIVYNLTYNLSTTQDTLLTTLKIHI